MVNEVPNKVEFDNEPVANLLRDLKRVDAPNDFDHRVKARIAQGSPAQNRVSRFPVWAKAAIPTALLLGVGGYVGFNSLPNQRQVQTVAEAPSSSQTVQPAPVAITAPVITESSPKVEIAAAQPAAARPRPADSTRGIRRAKTAHGGGSVDYAVRAGRTIEVTDIPVTDALTRAGAKVSFDGTSMKVRDASGAAVKAGLKPGDVIESIDGKGIDARSTVKGNAAGKKLRIRRDGKSLDLVIKN